MNTNRSTKLGTGKGLVKLGGRKGYAAYQSLQRHIARQKLIKAFMPAAENIKVAFRRFAHAAEKANMDFNQYVNFLQNGPLQHDNSLLDHGLILAPCGDNPWFKCPGHAKAHAMKASPGISVQELTDLAQQYAYLHPNK